MRAGSGPSSVLTGCSSADSAGSVSVDSWTSDSPDSVSGIDSGGPDSGARNSVGVASISSQRVMTAASGAATTSGAGSGSGSGSGAATATGSGLTSGRATSVSSTDSVPKSSSARSS